MSSIGIDIRISYFVANISVISILKIFHIGAPLMVVIVPSNVCNQNAGQYNVFMQVVYKVYINQITSQITYQITYKSFTCSTAIIS